MAQNLDQIQTCQMSDNSEEKSTLNPLSFVSGTFNKQPFDMEILKTFPTLYLFWKRKQYFSIKISQYS